MNWGGTEMTSSTVNFALPTPVDSGTTRTWEYSLTTPISPSSANYTGPAFYGALMTDRTGVTSGPVNFNQTQVHDGGDGGLRTIATGLNPGSDTGRIVGLIAFKKEDFENLADERIQFSSGNSALINWGNYGGASGGVRAAVLSGSTWYLSQSIGSGWQSQLAIPDLSTELWGAWSPAGAPLSAAPTAFSTPGTSLNDVQAVGYFFDIERTGNQAQVWMLEVQFSGTKVIPEPGTMSFLLFAGCLLFALRRRFVTAGP